MRYRLVSIGKLRESYMAQAAADFSRRLRRYAHVEEIEIAAASGARADDAMREEGERILRTIAPGDHVWLLERTGAMFSSEELSARIEALEVGGVSRVTLVIAGTYGAAEELKTRADLLWSLGPLTLLHEWARALVLEQLYRAAKIARNEPYHH